MVRILIMTVLPDRQEYYEYLKQRLPSAEFIFDEDRNAMSTFKKLLKHAGNDPVLIMEDDVILTENFKEKVEEQIKLRPNQPIQFFSRRKKDETEGSRNETGSSFVYNLCFYVPQDFASRLLEYHDRWPRLKEHQTGNDLMVADFLVSNKIKYYVHVPSLVQHRIGTSSIDSRRAKKRISQTFK